MIKAVLGKLNLPTFSFIFTNICVLSNILLNEFLDGDFTKFLGKDPCQMKWHIPLWWISACITGEMLEGPVELMDHVLYVQGKGCLGSSHTRTLFWLELALSQIVPHTYKKDKHYQGISFPQKAVHCQPKKTNTKTKKALMMQLELTLKILFLHLPENNQR